MLRGLGDALGGAYVDYKSASDNDKNSERCSDVGMCRVRVGRARKSLLT